MINCLSTMNDGFQEKPVFVFSAFNKIIEEYEKTFADNELDHINISQFLNECEFTVMEERTRQAYSVYLKENDDQSIKDNKGIRYINMKRRLDDLLLVDKIMCLFSLMTMHLYNNKNPLLKIEFDNAKRSKYGSNYFYVKNVDTNAIPKKDIMRRLNPIVNQMNNFFMEMLKYKHNLKEIESAMAQEKKVDEVENNSSGLISNINTTKLLGIKTKTKKSKKSKKDYE